MTSSSASRRWVQATFLIVITASLTRCDCAPPNTNPDGGDGGGGGTEMMGGGGGIDVGGGTGGNGGGTGGSGGGTGGSGGGMGGGTGGSGGGVGGGSACVDQDNDGYGTGCQADDCNDGDATIHPGATELCNGVDDNCNAMVDEGLADLTCGVGACARTVVACISGVPQQCVPGTMSGEQCNGIDDDCNGVVDDGPAGQSMACMTGQDGVCAPGLTQCTGDGGIVCVAQAVAGPEACNGLDDNCNGAVDENDPDGGVSCNSGQLGACLSGVSLCSDGGILCVPLAAPSIEWCNGIDDNCDGTIDDGNPDSGVACSTGLLGVCNFGSTTCADGGLVCVQQFTPVAEVCNGQDDNCDGTNDENNPGGNIACDTGLLGVCRPGATNCADGGIVCVGTAGPSTEACNGLDDNCDGVIDDGQPGAGASCTTGNAGRCSAGSTICSDGGVACVQTNQPIIEACNGQDDNCDGTSDEGNPDGGLACSTGMSGICAAGTTSCTSGSIACNQNVSPSNEICDGLDNDCDGTNDDGNPGSGDACSTGQQGVCAAGTTNCTSGAIVCNRNVGPSSEVCDGLDNNCDGTADDGNPGGNATCNTGNPGVCAAGTTACTGGQVRCNQNVGSSSEVCDGLDNNCNGTPDEGNPGGGVPCNTGLLGVCAAGTTSCVNGAIVCNQNVQPSAEVCDGLDNNCNGTPDDGNPGGGLSCNTGNMGVCAAGTTVCSNGAVACSQNVQPSAEVCDGLDNNCNGTPDDGNPGGGIACNTGNLGVCAAGTTVCSSGAIACNQNVQPSAEVCDGRDNNCNGSVDDGNPGGGVACNTGNSGVCAAGTTVCSAGAIACNQNVQPSAEVCDGLDNNCNGSVDDGNPGGGANCNTGLLGVCSAGTTACTAGALVCNQNVQPSAEVCDAVDNNCNGQVNEGNPGGGVNCNTGQQGVCSAGTTACTGNTIVCNRNVNPSTEVCDGRDNDCNGVVDNGNPGGGVNCNTGLLGVCSAGTTVCSNGAISCNQNVISSAETCDGLDNNCNGAVDDGNPGGGLSCNTGLLGVCSAGTTVCTNGAVACNQNVQPSPEVCDSLDNNCNGQVNEGNPGGGVACGTGQAGVCAAGTTACSGTTLVCNRNVNPSTEVCDGLDNDCNGVTDNGNPGGNQACNTGKLGVCAAGTTACTGGALACNQNVQPSTEICDGVDNDCNGQVDINPVISDGMPNTCASAGNKTVSVVPGGSQTVTGYVDVNGDDYFIVNFSGAGGPGGYYHPKIDLTNSAAGQFILSIENSCGSGVWCGTNVNTVEMSFPSNPNSCSSFGNCTDSTPRYTQWVVRIRRTSGSPTCAQYQVTVSNL